jgi:TolB protein
MFKFLKKRISTSIAIGIILVLTIFVGGVIYWQYQEMQKEELGGAELSVPEKEELEKEEEEDAEEMSESTLRELCEKESWPPHCSFISHSPTRELCEKCKELGIEGKEAETIEPLGLTQLTFLDNAGDQDWSPDGSQIAFLNAVKNRIGIINVDGTGLRYLDIGGDPNWSPVENKLAVMAWKKEQNLPDIGIYLVDLDTGEVTFLIMGNQTCWSPDGIKIAYSLDEEGLSSIWVINSDGSGKTRLTFKGDGYCTGLSFSYDGSKIVYLKGFTTYTVGGAGGEEVNEIWVMNSDGSNEHMIYAPGDSSQLIFQRAWNKDNKILFMRNRHRSYPQVWIINSDGSDPHSLVQNSRSMCGDPVWNNDGTKVAIFTKSNVWTFPYK